MGRAILSEPLLDDRTYLSDTHVVNGKQFIRQVRKWAKANDLEITVFKGRGKGGHQIVQVGPNLTTVKTGELGVGLLADMLSQLGIPKEEF